MAEVVAVNSMPLPIDSPCHRGCATSTPRSRSAPVPAAPHRPVAWAPPPPSPHTRRHAAAREWPGAAPSPAPAAGPAAAPRPPPRAPRSRSARPRAHAPRDAHARATHPPPPPPPAARPPPPAGCRGGSCRSCRAEEACWAPEPGPGPRRLSCAPARWRRRRGHRRHRRGHRGHRRGCGRCVHGSLSPLPPCRRRRQRRRTRPSGAVEAVPWPPAHGPQPGRTV
jgi:hypothetical protein